MMTKKVRENLRAWCVNETSSNSIFVSNWAQDTIELIDTLNETEKMLAANREELKQADANSAAKDIEYKKAIEEMKKEISNLKSELSWINNPERMGR